MNHQIVISGVGGQGVLFITGLLATACMQNATPVLTSETHGMAQRGGTVISHLKIGHFSSPLIRPGNADLLIALKAENLDQHRGFLKPGGIAVVNTHDSAEIQPPPDGSTVFLDGDRLAETAGTPGSINLYMLGAALFRLPLCPLDRIKRQLTLKLAGKNSALLEAAIKALDTGFAAAEKRT